MGCRLNRKTDNILQPSDKVICLKIPHDTKCISQSLEYYANDTSESLYYLNDINNKILIFDLVKKRIIREIQMQEVGPVGVGKVKSIMVCHPDTILLTTGRQSFLTHINRNGVILKKYNINNYNNYSDGEYIGKYVAHTLSFSRQLIVHDEKIFAGTHYPGYPEPKTVENLRLCIEIDLEDGKQEVLPLTYPILNEKSNKPVYTYFSKVYVDGKFVYSFLNSHKLLVTGDHINAHEISRKSKYIKKDFKLPNFTGGPLEIAKTVVEHPSYRGFYYDKYREVYYRFVYPGVNTKNSDNLMELHEFRPLFSIMVLDKDLNVIAEQLMSSNTYFIDMAFVAKDGLYISINHFENPEFDEDYLKFQHFNLVTNTKSK